MKSVVLMSPFRCRMWALHDRLEAGITEETCKLELDSFLRQGQLVPVLGRSLKGVANYDVELIYGARRLFVARHINKPLAVELDDDLSDRAGIIAMDIENRHRKDISPYERGISYARLLREGYFESQDEIARALRVSPSQISRPLKVARLPSIIVNAFASPVDICEGWGLDLIEALTDPQTRAVTLKKARAIAMVLPRPSPRDVYQQLLTASEPCRKVKSKSRDEVITDDYGAPLFRIRQQTASIAFLLPSKNLSRQTLENIRRRITEELRACTRQRESSSASKSYIGPNPVNTQLSR